jgi:hypothetical protein
MKTYTVTITELHALEYYIDAESPEQAEGLAETEYTTGKSADKTVFIEWNNEGATEGKLI